MVPGEATGEALLVHRLRDLVRPDDEGHLVEGQELLCEVGAEGNGVASTGVGAHAAFVHGVAPQGVVEDDVLHALRGVGDVSAVVDAFDHREAHGLPREAAVHDVHLVVDHGREGKQPEELLHRGVDVLVVARVLLLDLLLEAVTQVHQVVLVVALVDPHAAGVMDAVRHQDEEDLERAHASVGDVAVHEVDAVGRGRAVLEEHPQQVFKLPVGVAADDEAAVLRHGDEVHRSLHLLAVCLRRTLDQLQDVEGVDGRRTLGAVVLLDRLHALQRQRAVGVELERVAVGSLGARRHRLLRGGLRQHAGAGDRDLGRAQELSLVRGVEDDHLAEGALVAGAGRDGEVAGADEEAVLRLALEVALVAGGAVVAPRRRLIELHAGPEADGVVQGAKVPHGAQTAPADTARAHADIRFRGTGHSSRHVCCRQ
eukprot:Rhum_TRINITY_DN14303_c26_g1::Rhum_TRINITY_DN14303_c26_g1_i1::g.80095::m.80095